MHFYKQQNFIFICPFTALIIFFYNNDPRDNCNEGGYEGKYECLAGCPIIIAN